MTLRSPLGHPALRPLKRAAKDAWWRYKGRTITNPSLPAAVDSVLFVCLGNICRSPFAEVMSTRRSQAEPRCRMRFGSAGIRTKQAAEPPPEARETAKRYGVSLDGHRPTQLTEAMMREYDLVVVMESGQRDLLRRTYPDCGDRVFLLSLLDEGARGMDRYNIADPFGLPLAAYDECYRRIDRAIAALLDTVCRDAYGRTREGGGRQPC